MILNLGSLAFNANIETGGGTPAWGTELGQGEGYKFAFEDMSDFFTGMVYKSVADIDKVTCPLGKGGNQRADYDFVIASLFDKVFVNGKRVNDARFLLLVVKKLNGDHHVGRRTIKYNPRMTYHGEYINEDCYSKMALTMGLPKNAAWFVYEILIINQDELHFSAFELGQEPQSYRNNDERKNAFLSRLPKGTKQAIRYNIDISAISPQYCTYLTAIRTKPFLLLAGISGTGKSRIVRKLAQATDDIDFFAKDEDRWKLHKPANFELIQVKPNWHNSMDVVGFQSNIPEPHYEFTPFVDFVVKAWCHGDTPFFLCLDEMNLAPVEEYFAEFLSAIESRSVGEDGEFETDPIIKPFDSFGTELSGKMMHHFIEMGYDLPNRVETRLRKKGLTLPKNLIVMGTVNMDETTFSFSRKVLDRAMSIEMNEVNYDDFLEGKTENDIPLLTAQNGLLVNRPISAQEVKEGIESQEVMEFLKGVNDILEGTPFKLGYRAANEAILYVAADKQLGASNLKDALDNFTLMKILSRIEGDDSKLVTQQGDKLLDKLYELLSSEGVFGSLENSKSLAKLTNMQDTLKRDHFVSFWG